MLALLATYARPDLLAALERAVRFGAYSLNAVERILAVQAQPKSILDILADHERRHLPPHLTRQPRLATPDHRLPAPLEEPTDHGPPQQTSDPPTADAEPRDDCPGRPA